MPYLDGVWYNDPGEQRRAQSASDFAAAGREGRNYRDAQAATALQNERDAAATALQNERSAAADARTQQMHDLEVARLAREAELQRQQGIVGAEWAVEFLGQWNQDRENLTGMVNEAFGDVDRAWESIESGKQWLTDLESTKSLVGQEFESFKEAYAPLEAESIQTQMEGLGTQRGLMERIRDLSTADLEGVSGRAKADVGSESEKARRAEDRRLQGLGMSPESGRSRSTMNRSFIDEALSKVLAANRARSMEQDRAGQMALGGMSVINPLVSGGGAGGISSGIRAQGLDYLREMTNIGATGIAGATGLAQAGGDLAQTRGGIADVYGRNIVQPMGEAGMSMLGTAMAAGPESLAGMSGAATGGAYAPTGTPPPSAQPAQSGDIGLGGGTAPSAGGTNTGLPYDVAPTTGQLGGLLERGTYV